VSESIWAFMISLLEAVAIVLALLAVTMGIRPGIIIGISGLVFPILGTFIVMAIMGIDLHRISLGAMIIAMGMMVDNAIVVTDSIMVRFAQGMDRKQAAIEAANRPAIPLLGATVVASNIERRQDEVPSAEAVIDGEADRYWNWLSGLAVMPVLTQFRQEMEALRERELLIAVRRMPDLTTEQRENIERFSRSLLNKFLHNPSIRLREAASNGRGLGVIDAAQYLFGLDGDDTDDSTPDE
jgi:hypothetical protein